MAIAISGKTYAQILDGRCHWLFTATELSEWNDEHITVVDVTEQTVSIGDTYDGERFIPVTPPSLATLRIMRQTAINSECNRALAQLTTPYPEHEVSSWSQQEREARALAAHPDTITPLLSAIASARGLAISALAARVRAKADAYAQASGRLIGQRQALEDALAAIDLTAPDAAAQIAAVQWPQP